MSRAAISVERVEFNRDEKNTVTVYEKQNKTPFSTSTTYTIMEFMALLAGHIPSPYESLVYYYGIYSSSYRGKEKRENADGPEVEVEEITGKSKASSTWAQLIRKIFEVDPLRCKKCGGEMKIIAFITAFHEIKKILLHIGEETQRTPPLPLKTVSVNESDNWYSDYIPPDDVYFRDEEYAY